MGLVCRNGASSSTCCPICPGNPRPPAERFPSLAARVGLEAPGGGGDKGEGPSIGLLQSGLTRQLYAASFGSAALAYYEAYLDAALGLALYTQRWVFMGDAV